MAFRCDDRDVHPPPLGERITVSGRLRGREETPMEEAL